MRKIFASIFIIFFSVGNFSVFADINVDAEMHIKNGDQSGQAKDYETAIKEYSKAIELSPTYSNIYAAYFGRSYVKFQIGDDLSGLEDIEKAIELKPNYALSYCVRATGRQLTGDYSGGLQDMKKAEDLGYTLARKTVDEWEHERYDEMLKNNPKKAYMLRGVERIMYSQDYESGIEDLSKAIEMGVDNEEIFFARGMARKITEDYFGAIQDFSNVIKHKPDHEDAYCQRGISKFGLIDYTGAIMDYTKSIDINKDKALAYFLRGNAKFLLKDKAGALRDLSKAGELGQKEAYDMIKTIQETRV